MSLHHYAKPAYDGLETSSEILAGIEEIAGSMLNSDETATDDESEAYRVWQEPTADEIKRVEKRAWELADAEIDVLHWGIETLKRPTKVYPDAETIEARRLWRIGLSRSPRFDRGV